MVTFTVEPTAEVVINGVLRHAWVIVVLVFLSGQLFAFRILEEDPHDRR